MKESTLQRNIITALQSEGYLVYKLTAPSFPTGCPDLLVMQCGRHIFLEIKTLTGRLSKVQKAYSNYLNKYGESPYVTRSVEQALEIVRKEIHG